MRILSSEYILKFKQKILILLMGLIYLLCFLHSDSFAVESYFVDPGGNNYNSGTIDSPWRTIHYAITKVKPGDTVFLKGGVYSEGTIYWNYKTSEGTPSSPITIQAYNDTPVIVDGGNIGSCMNLTTSDIVLKNITFRNFQTGISISSGGGITIDGCSIYNITKIAGIWIGYVGPGHPYVNHNVVKNCNIYNIGTSQKDHGIYLACGSRDTVIMDSYIHNNDGGGIHAWHAPATEYNKIVNNVIANNKWGVLLAEGSHDNSIINNTFINNRDADIHLYFSGENNLGVKNTFIFNNLFYHTIKEGKCLKIASFNFKNVSIDNNWYYQPSGNPILWGKEELITKKLSKETEGRIDSHSGEGDPGIVDLDLEKGTYKLSASSPLINKGKSFDFVKEDFEGVKRALNPAIGAYEYSNR